MGLIISHLAPLSKVRINRDYNTVYGTAVTAGATPPSDRVYMLQNRLFRDLYSIGVIQKMDIMYNFTHDGDEVFGRYNWCSAGNNTLTKSGTLTFTSKDGVKGDGSTGYYSTNWSALSNGVNFGSSPAYSMFSVIKESSVASGFIIGRTDSGSTNHLWMRGRSGTDSTEIRMIQNSNFLTATGLITDGSGFWYAEKNSTLLSLYRNNTLVDSRNDAPQATRCSTVGLFARLTSTVPDNFYANTQRIVGIGGNLTAAQRQGFQLAWDLYFSSL